MWYIVCSLLILGLFAAAMNLREDRKRKRRSGSGREAAAEPEATAGRTGCCGQHAVCERDRLPAAAAEKVEYYDDEELDAYRGTSSDAYPEEAEDAFREVLYTLRESEVAGWLCSLQLRGVHLPDALKDEAFLIVGEQRGMENGKWRMENEVFPPETLESLNY
ncbi:MAG: phospholipase [Tannerella sp.]|jgi:hypothetical protein|nr:phospholipase [Tannerella sp.]